MDQTKEPLWSFSIHRTLAEDLTQWGAPATVGKSVWAQMPIEFHPENPRQTMAVCNYNIGIAVVFSSCKTVGKIDKNPTTGKVCSMWKNVYIYKYRFILIRKVIFCFGYS